MSSKIHRNLNQNIWCPGWDANGFSAHMQKAAELNLSVVGKQHRKYKNDSTKKKHNKKQEEKT
jgi:hypothetical protein